MSNLKNSEIVKVDVVQVEGEHMTAEEYHRAELNRMMDRARMQQAQMKFMHEKARETAQACQNTAHFMTCSFTSVFAHAQKQSAPVFKKWDRVYVHFISESATEFSGRVFKGDGVIDRAEDGYLFGRLDDGRPFMCKQSDAIRLATIDDDHVEDGKGLNKALLFVGILIGVSVLKFFNVI